MDAVRGIFAAATADDLFKFHHIAAADFYAFDAGMRFSGDQLMRLIKAEHAAGRQYVWMVTEPDVHVCGTTAWIAYVNQGSIQRGTEVTKLTWLESAFLEKQKGSWRIHFVHSTPVTTAAPAK